MILPVKKIILTKLIIADTFNNIQDACKNVDLIILHTEWDEFKTLEFKKIVKNNKFKIFDLRNLYNNLDMKKKKINTFQLEDQIRFNLFQK